MTDHDRSYPPYDDEEPLAFDARQSRGRRGFPTTLVISLVVLIGVSGAIYMFYRSGVRGAGEGPVAIGTPVGDLKAAPPPTQTAPPQDAASGLKIYQSDAPPAAAGPSNEFGPAPEQPRPRPVPTAPVAAAPAPPAASPSAALVAASGATAPAAAAPAPPAAKAPPPGKLAEAKPAPARAKAQDEVGALLDSAPPAAPAKAPAAAHGGALAQIGAYSSEALANKGLVDLAAVYGGDLSGKHRLVEPVERDGKTLYRAAVAGFATREAAADFCGKLNAAGKACIVR